MATPTQNSVQFGSGIKASPPIVMPTRQIKTAVQAAGDDPCDMRLSSDVADDRASAYSVGSRPSSSAAQMSSSVLVSVLPAGDSYRLPIVGHVAARRTTTSP